MRTNLSWSTRVDSGRSHRIALLDWDGTVRQGVLIQDFLDYLCEAEPSLAGFNQEAQELLERHKHGELTYQLLANELPQVFADATAGWAPDDLSERAEEFMTRDAGHATELMPFAQKLFRFLDEHGVVPVVISGAPDVLLEAYSRRLPIGAWAGVRSRVRHGRLTNRLDLNPATRSTKHAIVQELASVHKVVFAAGDSDSDEPLFRAAGTGLVVGSAHLQARVTTFRLAALSQEDDPPWEPMSEALLHTAGGV